MSTLNSWHESNFIASISAEHLWFLLAFPVFPHLTAVANYINKSTCCIGFTIIALAVNITIVT